MLKSTVLSLAPQLVFPGRYIKSALAQHFKHWQKLINLLPKENERHTDEQTDRPTERHADNEQRYRYMADRRRHRQTDRAPEN
jgi:hypothetical protein